MRHTNPEDFNSLIEMMTYFSNEKVCHEYLQERRWQVCPHCDHEKVYCFSDGRRFKCVGCKKQFTATVGTMFESSKIPLQKWFVALYLHINHKKGVSSHQLARDLRVTQSSAWFMLKRLRNGLSGENELEEELEGVLEVDETFTGGRNHNRYRDKKVPQSQGRSFKDKTPIFGIMQRGERSRVKTFVVPDTKGETLQPIILKSIKQDSTIVSDEWLAYKGLGRLYDHHVIDHGRKQYKNGEAHTNTIEGFWAWIKRMIMGVYHVTSRKHLQLYANEATFRYNTRHMNVGGRIAYALSLPSRPLKYKDLIGKH